jgi:sigma-B regulation protein RsbU (phosphoserine phosphatase)
MNLKRRVEELERELAAAKADLVGYKELMRDVGMIQRSFLPGSLPYLEGYDFGAINVPARKTGGDFHDFLPILEGTSRIGIAMGDISGKGLEAAMYMALTHGMLHAGLSLPTRMSPEQVGLWLDLQLKQIMDGKEEERGIGAFVALTYGVLDGKENSFEFMRAGNERPLLFDSSGRLVYESSKSGQVLGMMEGAPVLDSDRLVIPPEGILALYTDGVTDQFGDNGQAQYGRERLKEIIADSRGLSAQEIGEAVLRDNEAYRENSPVFDDRTILVIKRE